MLRKASNGWLPDDPGINRAQRGVKHLIDHHLSDQHLVGGERTMDGRVMTTLQVVLGAVGEGRIRGGWEYVWAAYGIAWTGLGLYALSLWRRLRREDRR
jgi:CcmD family protein